MRTKSLFLLLFLLPALLSFGQSDIPESGKINLSELHELEWFQQGYKTYSPKRSCVRKLKKDTVGYRMIVFAGTWCPDTRLLLPQFAKTLHAIGFPEDSISLYLLDRSMNSPEGLEDMLQVGSVPTFIIFLNGEEVGRITETVNNSIECDLYEMIRRENLRLSEIKK